MHWRRLFIISLCCFAVIAASFFSGISRPNLRMDVQLVNVVAHGATNDVTAEFHSFARSGISAESLEVQPRVAGQWREPQLLTDYWRTYVPTGAETRRVTFPVPAGADACRFLLAYRTIRMGKCRAYSLVNRYGLGHLPDLWKIKLARIMSQPSGLRQVQCELTLPPDMHDKLVVVN